MPQTASRGLASEPRFFLAFEAPAFRWVWLNSLFSSAAWTLESLTHGWIILVLTNSPFWVGLVMGVRGIGQVAFSIPGGALSDRIDRRRILLITQTTATAGLLVLAALAAANRVRPIHVLFITLLTGFLAAVEKPAASGLMYDVVGGKRLLNASAFQVLGGSVVRMVAAVAGGYMLGAAGIAENYLMAAGAHVMGGACVFLLRPSPHRSNREDSFVTSVRTGFKYAISSESVRRLLALSLVIETLGFSYNSMLPVLARNVLRVGGVGLGYLSAGVGFGQLGATLLIAARGDFKDRERALVVAAFGFGLCVVVLGISPWFALSLLTVGCVGVFSSVYDATMTTVLMTVVSNTMRGRVLGFYYSTLGLNHLGGLFVGALAIVLGTPLALAGAGGAAAAGALALLVQMRRIAPGGPGDKALRAREVFPGPIWKRTE